MVKRTWNQTEVAEAMGVTRVTVIAWTKEGMPANERKDKTKGVEWRYDLPSCIQWYKDREVLKATGNDLTKKHTLIAAQIREREAVAGLRELELAERQKELIALDDILLVLDTLFGTIKARFRAIPGRLRSKVPDEYINLVSKELDDTLGLVALTPDSFGELPEQTE
jgi:phage terminase Nu1 subunit (DNA packaging protein)